MFYLGGKEYGVNGRIKDFHIISPISGFELGTKIIVTAGSDGAVMIWKITSEEIQIRKKLLNGKIKGTASNDPTLEEITNHDLDIPRVGILLAKYDTGNRITCMKSFELHGSSEDYNEDPQPDNVPVSEQKSSEDDTLDDEEEGFEGFQ